jgi:hypothetical protein
MTFAPMRFPGDFTDIDAPEVRMPRMPPPEVANAKPRSGFQDFIGRLGDFGLISSGRAPLYGPRVAAEKAQAKRAAAMSGFTENPMEAVRQLVKNGFHEEATELYDKVTDNNLESRKEDRQGFEYEDKFNDYVGAAMGAANPSTWGRVREVLGKIASKRGLVLPMELPEQYDQSVVDFYTNRAYPVKDRMADEALQGYRDTRLGQMDRDLDIDEQRANETATHNRNTERNTAVGNQIRAAGVKVQAANSIRQERDGAKGGKTQRARMPSKPPRRKGDKFGYNSGEVFISHDGKTWSRLK